MKKKINIFESVKIEQIDEHTKNAFESLINKVFQKKYNWFIRIIFESLTVSKVHVRPYLGIRAKIYVDADWGGKQWREYHYSEPIPNEDEELPFGDIIGGNLSRDIQQNMLHIFQMVTGTKVLLTSFSWVDTYLVERPEEDF